MYKLSIIIATYNAENTIKRCLESVFNNACSSKVELIVVNDCSTDNTLTLIEECAKAKPEYIDLKIINQKQNCGPAISRNVGLQNCNGLYVGFLDSDDELKPDYISTILNIIEESKANVIGINADVDDNGGRYTLLDNEAVSNLEKYGLLKEALLFSGDGFTWSHIYKKELIDRLDLDSLEKLIFTEDLNFNIEIALKNDINFSFINKNIYVYYFPQGTHISRINEKKINDALYVIDKRYRIVKNQFPELLDTFKVGNLKASLRLIYAVKKTKNFDKKQKKVFLKKLRTAESIRFTLKLGFKTFMKLSMKDKIRYILYK